MIVAALCFFKAYSCRLSLQIAGLPLQLAASPQQQQALSRIKASLNPCLSSCTTIEKNLSVAQTEPNQRD